MFPVMEYNTVEHEHEIAEREVQLDLFQAQSEDVSDAESTASTVGSAAASSAPSAATTAPAVAPPAALSDEEDIDPFDVIDSLMARQAAHGPAASN